jgi:hypothetical protein
MGSLSRARSSEKTLDFTAQLFPCSRAADYRSAMIKFVDHGLQNALLPAGANEVLAVLKPGDSVRREHYMNFKQAANGLAVGLLAPKEDR